MNPAKQEFVCPALQLRQQGLTLTQSDVKSSLLARVIRKVARFYLPGGSPSIPDAPRSIVLLAGGNLGGTILTLPLAEAVKRRFPEAHLTIICNTVVGKEFMEAFGPADVVRMMSSSALKGPRQLVGYLRQLWDIRKNHPDLLISNHDSHVDPFLIPLRIPVRVGHTGTSLVGRPLRWGEIYNVSVLVDADKNWLESYGDLAERLSEPLSGPPRINVSSAARDHARKMLAERGVDQDARLVAIQVGVWKGLSQRQWPLTNLVELCRTLWNNHQIRPVLLGDRGGLEAVDEIRSMAPDLPFVSLVGETTVSEAAGAISQCALSVCNDSGLMHLSAAVGTPTVGIFGMTNPNKSWCYDLPHRFVRRIDCLPCYDLDIRVLEGCSHRMCLTRLDSETVVETALQVLGSG